MSATVEVSTIWQRYTPAEDAELRLLVSSPNGTAKTWEEIAVAMRRTPHGVRRRARNLGLTPDPVTYRRWRVMPKAEMSRQQVDMVSHYRSRANAPKQTSRVCLGRDCGRHFMSDGPGNRMCAHCRETL